MIRRFGELAGFALLVTVLVVVPVASTMADTSAASYHWARKRSQFTLKVGDNVSGDWNTYLRRAISDWNKNDTVTLDKVGGGTRPGLQSNERVEVCNWPYGTQKGWLGLTRLYFNNQGDHIEAVTVQLNDSFLYAPNSRYNNNAARRHTICHELGHSIGLEGHDDNRSCMNDSRTRSSTTCLRSAETSESSSRSIVTGTGIPRSRALRSLAKGLLLRSLFPLYRARGGQ